MCYPHDFGNACYYFRMQCQVPVITVYQFTEFSVQVNHIIIRLVVVHDTAAASVQLLVLMSSWSPLYSPLVC
jgi:hypothetical protein